MSTTKITYSNNRDCVSPKPVKYINNNPTNFYIEEKYLSNGYDQLCFFYKLADYKDESEIRILRSMFGGAYFLYQTPPSTIQQIQSTLRSVRYGDSIKLKIDSANKLIQQIVISPHAHDQFIKTVQQSIENINVRRQRQQIDLIECDLIESRRKEWV